MSNGAYEEQSIHCLKQKEKFSRSIILARALQIHFDVIDFMVSHYRFETILKLLRPVIIFKAHAVKFNTVFLIYRHEMAIKQP